MRKSVLYISFKRSWNKHNKIPILYYGKPNRNVYRANVFRICNGHSFIGVGHAFIESATQTTEKL